MIIYMASNSVNNKKYIGQTTRSLVVRINEHHCFAYTKNSLNPFHRALRKYGKQMFKWSILHECQTQKDLIYF
jgi:hypothetical protein